MFRVTCLSLLAAALLSACGPMASKSAHAAGPARPSDPRTVIESSCGEMAPGLCQCVTGELIEALERGPRMLLGFLELPGAAWDQAMASLEPKDRAQMASLRSDIEGKCEKRQKREKAAAGWSGEAREGVGGVSRQRARQVVLNQCMSTGNERAACDCFAATVLDTLAPGALSALAADARFPPPLEGLTRAEKRLAMASIGVARSVCGVK